MNLVDFIYEQREFSDKTFGPGRRTLGILKHIHKETQEIKQEPEDLEEWIDIVLLAIDGACRVGYAPEQIVAKLEDKLARNKQRNWPDWRDSSQDSPIEHRRDDE